MEPVSTMILRMVHVSAVLASGAGFCARGIAQIVFAARWPMAKRVRYLTYAIDTVLLGAAVLLMGATEQYPFKDSWLTLKLVLVGLYIVLGSTALKHARSKPAQLAAFAAGLIVFATIITIARAHSPLGPFKPGFHLF